MVDIAFSEITIIITIAALLGIIASKIKQPPLLGYIVAGILISQFEIIKDQSEVVGLFAHIGIAFLLFILGLELDLRDLKKLGSSVIVLGIGQILITFVFAFVLTKILFFSTIASILVSIAITFSSTIVIVKLFTSKNEMSTLHGKLAIGLLLIQDLFAIFVMVILTAFSSSDDKTPILSQLGLVVAKFVALTIILVIVTKTINWIIDKINDERETLFVMVIAWSLFFSTLAASPIFEFSIEIGAFMAGIALSSRREHLQIESWTRPLRDFFLTIFFVELGLNMSFQSIGGTLFPALCLIFFVLVIKPLILISIIAFLGYNKRSNFFTSISIGQVSEFSLLIASLGLASNYLDEKSLGVITVVTGTTMAISTYLINHKEFLYLKCKKFMNFYSQNKRGSYKKSIDNHTVIFGFHRLGSDLYDIIKQNPDDYLIIDHDPFKAQELEKEGINVLYGDMRDVDIFDTLNLQKARLIVSTVPEKEANLALLEYLKNHKLKTPTVLSAKSDQEATALYEMGGDFVLYPHMLASQKLKSIVKYDDAELLPKITALTQKQIKSLEKRLSLQINQVF